MRDVISYLSLRHPPSAYLSVYIYFIYIMYM